MRSRTITLLFFALTLAACTPTPPVPHASPTFTPGVTTYQQVVQAWGPPTNAVVQLDGRKTVTYVQPQGSPNTYVLEFGPDGTLLATPNP